tara:strand:- start:221 stop:1468 length:1248 start_codon:yes stop_codon:yes gene_type:complete
MTQDEMLAFFAAMQQPQSMVQNQIDMTGRGSGDQRTNLNQFGNVYQNYKPMVQLTDEERDYYDQLGNGNALGAYMRSVDPQQLEERGIDLDNAMFDLPSRKFTEKELEFLDEQGVAAEGGNVGILNIDSQPVQDLLSQMEDTRYMTDEQRKQGGTIPRDNVPGSMTDEQRREGGKLPKEQEEKEGFFKRVWNKFTDPNSTAPRNLLDFGQAMIANSEGAGDNFMKVLGQSVGDTIDKADARKIAALDSAKADAKSKLDRASTLSDIYKNTVETYTTEQETMQNGLPTTTNVTDWDAVAKSLRSLDTDGDYFSDEYLANMVANQIGMPEYDADNKSYNITAPVNDKGEFQAAQEIAAIIEMNPGVKLGELNITLGNKTISIADYYKGLGIDVDEEEFEKKSGKRDASFYSDLYNRG